MVLQMSEDKLGYASLKPEGGIENDWESRHPLEHEIPYAEMDRPLDGGDYTSNTVIQSGEMNFEFYREKPYTWLQVKLLRFCLGFEVTKNG